MDKRITNITLRDLLRSLGDLLMPRVCAVCGRPLLARERHLCLVCEAGLPLTHFERLLHNPMADAFNSQVEATAYERAAALFYYRSDYRKITQALKYGRNFGLGRRFARELGSRLAASGLWSGVNLVCPVPLHWTRRWLRGYNQASLIAREVALALRQTRTGSSNLRHSERLSCHSERSEESPSSVIPGPFPAMPGPPSVIPGPSPAFPVSTPVIPGPTGNPSSVIPGPSPAFPVSIPVIPGPTGNPSPVLFVPNLLRRVRRTGTQTRLAHEARAVNVSGAFCVRERVARRLRTQIGPVLSTEGPQSPSPYSNPAPNEYEILIIDDVFTTGATLAACHAALRAAFGPSVRISVATLAFVD